MRRPTSEPRESMLETSRVESVRTARELEREAARCLADALAQVHDPSLRRRYRELLEEAVTAASWAVIRADEECARAELEPTELEPTELEPTELEGARRAEAPLGLSSARLEAHATARRARLTLAKAHAARARNALHGANQLSLSAQRAPTLAACDDGWRSVEALVAEAEASARVAATLTLQLEQSARLAQSAHSKQGAPSWSAARVASAAATQASAAAQAARKLLADRNHAYTFHTDHRSSFGEGWYVAAASVLAGAQIQVEPSQAATPQAAQFLRDAGLSQRLQPYSPRPRALKHTTELVARAFRDDPASAQRRLRAAFLGQPAVPVEVCAWVDSRIAAQSTGGAYRGRVLLWLRYATHQPERNTNHAELLALTARIRGAGLEPILVGDALRDGPPPEGALNLILFWKDQIFQGVDGRRAQLQFFEYLRLRHRLVGQLGVTTAGMDGPALMGLPTMYLTDAPNVRMREWVGAVPGYLEVVRSEGYLERIEQVLREWANAGTVQG